MPTRKEAHELAFYILLLPFVFLPPSVGTKAAGLLARFLMRRSSEYHVIIARLMPGAVREALGPSDHEAAVQAERVFLREKLLLMHAIITPWRSPRPRLRGIEHLEEALIVGRGVILWVHPCLGSNVAVKRALSESGHPLVHLSRPGHPFSSRPFGIRVMNPLLRRPEVRFLRERVQIDDENMIGPLRRLKTRLAENLPVSITFTPHASTVNSVAFLDGTCRLPAGPIELAASTGARLLPVFTVGSGRCPIVIIGPSQPVTGKGGAAIAACQESAVTWLEKKAREYPADWLGWRVGLFRPLPT
ncbi:MAG: hypothetical protein ABI782_05425 [Anaerolineaceae bacterium]